MMSTSLQWEQLYSQVPLCDVKRHFAGIGQSPFMMQYLSAVLKHCPRGGRTCETGIGNGFGAVWLSRRGVLAEGIDVSMPLVERAQQINNVLGGRASFRTGDLFQLFHEAPYRYDVIHHQGVLEHFPAPQIHSALAQQVTHADHVIFSVPSVYYGEDPEMGDERLLPLEEWERILEPFKVEDLRYYGHPHFGERDHVLCVLRGQKATDTLRALMTVPEEPYEDGLSAIVHTRNESARLEDCLRSLEGVADELIVCDMESTDDTVEIAKRFTDVIVPHPHIANFDRARNVSAMRAKHKWILYVDADERVPPGLGPQLRHLIDTQGGNFEGVLIPFRHFFAGRWMQCLYPGYTAPRLLKNGKFVFNARAHSGAQVDGRTIRFPADNPDLALTHLSFDSLAHYLDKLNRYTDNESANMHRDGQPFHWQGAIRHFVRDFQGYYDYGGAPQDGVHGFLYSFLSAFYRFEQHAKLYERRFHAGQLQPGEMSVPGSVEEILQYALSVVRERKLPPVPELPVNGEAEDAAEVVWTGPLHDPSGYGEESRNFLFALDRAGARAAGHSIPWSSRTVELTPVEANLLEGLCGRPAEPGFVHVIQNFAPAFSRHPAAGASLGRTMFETDRLPPDWVKDCNQMDWVWVPTEFNRQTFAASGVAEEKLVVIPGCFDPEAFQTESAAPDDDRPLGDSAFRIPQSAFKLLSLFDWTSHKGWDVLLKGFLRTFEGNDDVSLLLKVWSTMGYSHDQIRQQAAELVKRELGQDLLEDERVVFLFDKLSQNDMLRLYGCADAFVLPSRGEGWGRPFMECMALGIPVIGTNWSGNTAFMTPGNSFLVDCDVVPVPESGWREIPTYRGHRWAEPNEEHLVDLLRRVRDNREEAAEVAQQGREHVRKHFTRDRVGQMMVEEITRVREAPQSRRSRTSRSFASGTATDPVTCHLPPVTCPSPPATSHPSPATCPSSSDLAVRWEGAQFVWHSLAHVNRELCLGLLDSNRVELSLVPAEPLHFSADEDPRFPRLEERLFAPLSQPATVHVRHMFPPRFERPEEGHLVLIQPWEYGYLPETWIDPIKENVSQVWCYSNYVRQVYLDSGIPEECVHVVPLGVDTGVFRPEAPPFVFTDQPGAARLNGDSRDRFTFLFTGGTLDRKGIDILLDAYLKAFSAYDDVRLVIKDTGTQTVYRGQNAQQKILGLLGDETRPPIVYLDDDLTTHQMAGIYTACDCLVQPYRGEGFCLPALESMACGRPAIVTAGGPTDDFVDETVGWRVPSEQVPFGDGRISEWECVDQTKHFEVSVEDLARVMREVYGAQEEAAKRGTAALHRAQEHWTWRHSTEAMLSRLEALALVALTAEVKDSMPSAGMATEGKDSMRSARMATKATKPKRKGRSAGTGKAPTQVREYPSISLCMIVRDEERVLKDCLKSIKPWVDEMIVVDTGSQDRTMAIAQDMGANVFQFPWCDSFSIARNESIKHATGEWILWMDADDTIPKECGQQLHDAVLLAEDDVLGIIMQVQIPPAPGEDGFTIVDHVKLFRNVPELRFEGRIHEQILEAINRVDGRVERSPLYVVHSGYDHSPEGQKRKRERDLHLLEMDLAERPDHPFVHFNIGMTHFHLKNFDQAISALERCLELSQPHESTVRKVYAMLASSHQQRGDMARAKECLEQGLRLFPLDPELLFRAGVIHADAGDASAAEQYYLRLMTQSESGHLDSIDVSITGYKAHHNLAVLYRDTERLEEAENQWVTALKLAPRFVPSWAGLGELYLRMRRFDDVRNVIGKLEELKSEEAGKLRGRLASVTG